MKENFNRWYTIFSYYLTETIIDFPITLICSSLFSIIIYVLSSQPMELNRFAMFFAITLLVVLIAQTIGLIVGACFNVVVSIRKIKALKALTFDFKHFLPFQNGTFVGPTLSVPFMMFSGFGNFKISSKSWVKLKISSHLGVRIIDLPEYMKWGSHISYLRYGLEGYTSALYGDRGVLACERAIYCHYK